MRFLWTIVFFGLTLAAFAQDPATKPGTTSPPGAGDDMMRFFLMMGSIFAIFYFLMIRPQQKQRQRHEEQISALKKGERIVGAGGIYGTIVGIKDDKAVIKIADNVKIEITKSSITHILEEKDKK